MSSFNIKVQAYFVAKQEIEKKLAKSDGNPIVCYEENDQSPLSGYENDLLKSKCSIDMDYRPYEFPTQYTAWTKTIYAGDYEGFLKILDVKTAEEINNLLKMRESLMNFCAVHHVVQGALLLHSQDPWVIKVVRVCRRNLNVKNEHIKILLKLLGLGVDVNAHDVAGRTPLHLCVNLLENNVTLKMAEILLKAGAEVDAKDRFGQTPMLLSTLLNMHNIVALLLKFGANSSSKDNYGTSPNDLVIRDPKIHAMFVEAEKKEAKEERRRLREKVGGRLSRCSVCGETSGTMKCSGCFTVWYCGTECQGSAWPSHKEECKEIRALYSVCVLRPNHYYQMSGKANQTGKLKETHFVVKIQRLAIKGSPLWIYNKDRSFAYTLAKEDNELVYSKLVKMITDQGVDGKKGFFHVIVPKKPEGKEGMIKLKINAENILPREAW